jgi:lipopolysaccharide transport system permease protein
VSSSGRAFARRLGRTWTLTKVLAAREFRIRYRQSVLEIGWSLVTPVVTLIVYGVVLTYGFKVNTDPLPYLSTVWVGLVLWTTFATAVGGGVYSVLTNGDLVSKIYFPREVLPLAIFGAALFDLLIGVAVLVPLVAIQVRAVGLASLVVIPALLVMLVWTAAIAVLVGVLAVFVRDVVHLVRLALLVGFFLTPVMYLTAGMPHAFVVLARINPLAVCIGSMRAGLITLQWPNMTLLALHGLLGLLVLGGAIAYTAAVEDRMVDVL